MFGNVFFFSLRAARPALQGIFLSHSGGTGEAEYFSWRDSVWAEVDYVIPGDGSHSNCLVRVRAE